MSSLIEVTTAIADAIVADNTMVALLADQGDGSTPAVYVTDGEIPNQQKFPAIRIFMVDDSPNVGLSAIGDYRPRVQIDILGTGRTARESIAARLDEILDVPRQVAAGFMTDNYHVRKMTRVGRAITLQTRLEVDGIPVKQMATDWDLKVTKQT